MFWDANKNSSRKFIDLIWRSSTKWAVWDPPSDKVEIGDYGTIDQETGRFEWRGNIFQNAVFKDLIGDKKPTTDSDVAEDVISVTSLNAKKTAIDVGLNANAQVAQASFKSKWSFGTRTGAVLAIHKPKQTALPHNLDLSLLTEHKALEGMFLVTSVTKCPAYALYLASKEDSGISLALCVEAPIGATPVSLGPNINTNWISEYGGGFYRAGNKTEDCFTVLFDLKECKFKQKKGWFRDSPSPELFGYDRLEDARPPWDLLDEVGEPDPPCAYQVFDEEINEDSSDEEKEADKKEEE